MKNKRCKTCKWSYASMYMRHATNYDCHHKKRAIIECAGERSKVGNCGLGGKHWEAKENND